MLKAHNIYYNSFRIEIYVHKFHAGAKWDLQQTLKKLKRGKTPGFNQIPTDVLKAGAAPLCHQLCALTTKVVAHCKEPFIDLERWAIDTVVQWQELCHGPHGIPKYLHQ